MKNLRYKAPFSNEKIFTPYKLWNTELTPHLQNPIALAQLPYQVFRFTTYINMILIICKLIDPFSIYKYRYIKKIM